jgi:hypothetical protein
VLSLARWTPDRPPERTDAVLFAAVVVLCWRALAETARVAWPWAVVGFGATALALGPLTETAAGQRVGDAVRALGPRAEKAATLVFVVTTATILTNMVPDDIAGAFAVGGCAALAVALVVNALPAARTRFAGHSP